MHKSVYRFDQANSYWRGGSCDGVAATAVGIGINRLATGEVHDHQKRDNREADTYDVSDPRRSERNEE